MNFDTSLEKEYYYSLNEVLKNDSFKYKTWKDNKDYLFTLKEDLFIHYDIDKIYLINEFFEKNNVNEQIPVLIDLSKLDLEELVEDDFSQFDNDAIDYYFRTKEDTYKLLYNKNLQEVDLEIKKLCEIKQQ